MRNETYDYLFENALLRAINDVLESIPQDMQTKYQLSYKNNLEERKKLIYEEYNNFRSLIRERYFEVGEDGKNLIDIHKICACFTAAIIKVRIFDYNKKDIVPQEIFYSNYSLAFLVGIHIMYLGLLSDYEKENKEDLFAALDNKKTFSFPTTNDGHDSYIHGRIKTLALNDMYGVDFDVLTYADMLYWIEEYNKYVLMQEVK